MENNNTDFKTSYDAGYNCGLKGANTDNSHFKWFASKESLKEWERGKRKAESRLDNAWADLGNNLYESGNEEPGW